MISAISFLEQPRALRLRAAAWVALLAGLALLAAPAGAVPIQPGEAFEVHFRLDGPPQTEGGDADVLTFELGDATHGTGVLGYRVELWDGADLLGVHTTSGRQLWAFTAPGSAWTLNAQEADLSSLAGGGIDGVVRVIPQFDPEVPGAQLDVQFHEATGLIVGSGVPESAGNSLYPAEPGPVIERTGAASVPEPDAPTMGGAAALSGVALLLARSARRRRGGFPAR